MEWCFANEIGLVLLAEWHFKNTCGFFSRILCFFHWMYSVKIYFVFWHWSHCKLPRFITAYRLHSDCVFMILVKSVIVPRTSECLFDFIYYVHGFYLRKVCDWCMSPDNSGTTEPVAQWLRQRFVLCFVVDIVVYNILSFVEACRRPCNNLVKYWIWNTLLIFIRFYLLMTSFVTQFLNWEEFKPQHSIEAISCLNMMIKYTNAYS